MTQASQSIPFVDLAAAHAEVADEVRDGFQRVLDTTGFVKGPEVAGFEREYADFTGMRYCAGVGNGTDAIEFALRAIGIPEGGEVIVPANTFVATAEAVVRAGARPVFADADADHLLTSRHHLANFTGYAGDAAAARDQFAALLRVRERVSGPNDPETLTTRTELAFWTGSAGDAARARDQLAELLSEREQILSAGHPNILATRASLARWTAHAGDAAGPVTSTPPCLRSASRSWVPSIPKL